MCTSAMAAVLFARLQELAVVPLASSDSGSGDTSSDSEDGDLPQPPVLKLPKTRRAKKRCIEELEPSK